MSVVINFKTDADVKKEAQEIAKEMGISLSAVLNMYLTKFVREKKLDIKVEKISNFNEQTQKDILEAEADRKAGRLKSYSPDEALEFVRSMINE